MPSLKNFKIKGSKAKKNKTIAAGMPIVSNQLPIGESTSYIMILLIMTVDTWSKLFYVVSNLFCFSSASPRAFSNSSNPKTYG